jgi:WD40 repeat protein
VGFDGAACLWDAATARLRATLRGEGGAARSVACSPDGLTLAVGSENQTITLWDVAAGRPTASLTGFPHPVMQLVFSPNGQTLASAGVNQGVFLWDMLDHDRRLRLSGGGCSYRTIAFTPDGVALVSVDATGMLWESATGRAIKTLPFEAREAWSLALSPNGRLLATGGMDSVVRLWDTSTWHRRAILNSPRAKGESVHLYFSPDSRRLAVCPITPPPFNPSRSLEIWDIAQAEWLCRLLPRPMPLARLDIEGMRFVPVAFAPDGRTLAVGMGNLLRLWRPVMASERPAPMSHAPDEAWAVAFSPDGLLLASGGDNEKGSPCLKVWEAATGKLRWAAAAHEQLLTCLAFSPDGSVLATAGYDGRIKLWDPATGRALATLDARLNRPRCLAFSPDSHLLSVGGEQRQQDDAQVYLAHIWDIYQLRLLRSLPGLTQVVRGVAFLPDGRHVVTTDNAQCVHLWEIATGHEVERWTDSERVFCVANVPRDKALVWGSGDGRLTWLDLNSRQTRTFAGHQPGEIRSLAFTPDGRRIATGGSDGTVRLWDTETKSELFVLPAGTQPINSVAFSAEGDRLAAASHDGAIRIWHAPRDE